MDLGLDDKVAVVTGGSKGIGLAIARSLAAEGCALSICARHESELEEAADELRREGVRVLAEPTDLTKEADLEAFVAATEREFGGADILVNNAGTVGDPGTLEEVSIEDWRTLFELNVFAVVSLTRALLPYMREQGWGRVINISSENGRQPYPDMLAYSASKGALDNFTKGLSKHCAEDGVLVNTVSPAFIRTPLVDEMMEKAAEEEGLTREEAYQSYLRSHRPHIEVGRPGEMEEVGPLVAFLASEQASFINGSDYRVDGGSVAAE